MSKNKSNGLKTLLEQLKINTDANYTLEQNEEIVTANDLSPGQIIKTIYTNTSTRPQLVVGVYDDSFDVMPLRSLDLSRDDVPEYTISFRKSFENDHAHVITFTNKIGKEFTADLSNWQASKYIKQAKQLLEKWDATMFVRQQYNAQTLRMSPIKKSKLTRIRIIGHTSNYSKAKSDLEKKLPIKQDSFKPLKPRQTPKSYRFVQLK